MLNRRALLAHAGMGLAGLALSGCSNRPGIARKPALNRSSKTKRPNVIVVFCDNLGYGDLSCFGSALHHTPHIDQLAAEGVRLTGFYSSSPVCTPSRGSLMTGCYAQRIGMHLSDRNYSVLQPVAAKGLNPDEITIADMLRGQGYATACIGKWHMGDQPPFLPLNHGFDYFYGIPYSEDMTEANDPTWPPVPLLRNNEVIEAPVDLKRCTKRYIQQIRQFIAEDRENPFFLYFAHHLPGSKMKPDVAPEFAGTSANGCYGDSVAEIDWSVGQIANAVKEAGLDEETMIIFTSDNGAPAYSVGGSNAPWSGWGYSTAEGGMRVPCIVRWPGMISAGMCSDELCTTMDILPTLATLSGTRPPRDRVIDGMDIWPIISGEPGARSPYEVFYYYMSEQLQAVRRGKWKLHLPLKTTWLKRWEKAEDTPRPMKLVDLDEDIGETTDLSQDHPNVVKELLVLAEKARCELGDMDIEGVGQRPAGFVAHPTAMRK